MIRTVSGGAGLVLLLVLSFVRVAEAASVNAAVAANFTTVATALAADFKAVTGDDVVLSFGATGALYAQITQGAPFEVFLAADDKRPAAAIAEGFGVAGTEFTYAVGRLALYAPAGGLADGAAVLRAGGFQHLAIADPKAAPYGAAALAVLSALGIADSVQDKIVTGENIAQALQFVETGNAELGFVALSQVKDRPAAEVWLVPADLHPPIRQNAVLLTAGAQNPSATAFLGYLASPRARALIAASGYGLD